MNGNDYDLAAITSGDGAGSGVPGGDVLVTFVEAVLDEGADPAPARGALRQALGDAALVDTAATVASFNAVVKVADGTGIPLEPWKAERTADIRAALAIDDLRSHDT